MRKKLLFLVSVFVVALFTISMAQGPEKTTEPKAATECCPQDCDHSRGYCADCACGDECRKGRCADCSTCAYAENCRKECPSDAKRDCRPARHCGLPVIAAAEDRPAERTMSCESATVRVALSLWSDKVRVFGRNHANGRFLRPSASAFRARRPSRRSCSRCRPLLRRE